MLFGVLEFCRGLKEGSTQRANRRRRVTIHGVVRVEPPAKKQSEVPPEEADRRGPNKANRRHSVA
jgi:hypothetical protein